MMSTKMSADVWDDIGDNVDGCPGLQNYLSDPMLGNRGYATRIPQHGAESVMIAGQDR